MPLYTYTAELYMRVTAEIEVEADSEGEAESEAEQAMLEASEFKCVPFPINLDADRDDVKLSLDNVEDEEA